MNEDKNVISIPYIAYESALEKADRQHKRSIIVMIALIVLIILNNLVWIYFWNQYDYVEDDTMVEVDSEGNGNANYIGNDGDINNGIRESYTQTENESTS